MVAMIANRADFDEEDGEVLEFARLTIGCVRRQVASIAAPGFRLLEFRETLEIALLSAELAAVERALGGEREGEDPHPQCARAAGRA